MPARSHLGTETCTLKGSWSYTFRGALHRTRHAIAHPLGEVMRYGMQMLPTSCYPMQDTALNLAMLERHVVVETCEHISCGIVLGSALSVNILTMLMTVHAQFPRRVQIMTVLLEPPEVRNAETGSKRNQRLQVGRG